ncbi:MAG: DUF6584 family protein [Pseudomonadota bacterium]
MQTLRIFSRRSSAIDLATPTKALRHTDVLMPALTFGLTGAIWLITGLWVLKVYNNSGWGFLGAAMILWAGFKALLFLITYAIVIYAAAFQPKMFGAVAERRHIARVNARIIRDLETGEVSRAIDRIHGLLCQYPDNMGLRRRLGIYLMQEGRIAEAGRFLMLHPAPTAQERQAIGAFCEANGNDPYQIMRKALRGISGAGLSKQSQHVLQQLYRSIDREADKRAWLYRAVSAYLARAFPNPVADFWSRHRAMVIECAVFAVTLILLLILGNRG